MSVADLRRERDNLRVVVDDLMRDLRIALYELHQRNREIDALARQLAEMRIEVAA